MKPTVHRPVFSFFINALSHYTWVHSVTGNGYYMDYCHVSTLWAAYTVQCSTVQYVASALWSVL